MDEGYDQSSDENAQILESSPLIFTQSSDNVLDARQRQRKNVVSEIITTEEAYLKHIYILLLFYVAPLRKDKKFAELSNASTKGDVAMLFSTVELLFDGNTELLTNIKKEMIQPEPKLGEVFLKMIDKLLQYIGVFCNHQEAAMQQISDYQKSSSDFRNFENQCKLQPEVEGLGIIDYICKPFQRLLKYHLLLGELLKCTPEDHSDWENIRQAITRFQGEVSKINQQKAKSDNLKKMLAVKDSIESGLPRGFKLFTPSRTLVFEGTLSKISGSHDQERHFFLFNDCLVYCKKKNTKYICRGVIYINKLVISDIADGFSFKIFRKDKNLTYILYGKTQQEKDIWMREIKNIQQKGMNPSSNTPCHSNDIIPGVKREIFKVYITKDTFNTLSVSPSVTSNEVVAELLKKQKITDLHEFYVILLVTKDKTVVLSSDDQPIQVQVQLSKNGLKFGAENYFRFCAKKDVPPGAVMRSTKAQSVYNRQTLQVTGSPSSSSTSSRNLTFVSSPPNNRIHSTPNSKSQKSFANLHNDANPRTLSPEPNLTNDQNQANQNEKNEEESDSFVKQNVKIYSQNPNQPQTEDSFLKPLRPLPIPKPKSPATKQTYAQTVMNNVQPAPVQAQNRPSNASSRPVIMVPKTMPNVPQRKESRTIERANTPNIPVRVAVANYQANFQNRRV